MWNFMWNFQTNSSSHLCQFVPQLKSVTKFKKSLDIHKNTIIFHSSCQFVPLVTGFLKPVTKFKHHAIVFVLFFISAYFIRFQLLFQN